MKARTEIAPGVYRFNYETFYGERVGVYLVELDDRVVLIDVPAFKRDSVEFVRSFNKPIECIATHGPTVIEDSARWQTELGVQIALHSGDRDDEWLRGVPDTLFTSDGHALGRLQVIHTPGHSDGSVCILDPQTRILFTGDTLAANTVGKIRDVRKGASHDTDSVQRFQSVQRLGSERFDSILPFHYSPILGNASAQLRRYLSEG